MNHTQLLRTKRVIEQFFYKARYNVALHSMLKSKKHAEFRKQIQSGLSKQINYFAKIQKVNVIVGVTKAEDITQEELLSKLRNIWVPLDTFVSKKNFEEYLSWAAEKAGKSVYSQLGIEHTFNLSDYGKVTILIQRRANKAIGQIDGTTQDWISKIIQKGVNSAESHFEIAKTLKYGAERLSEYRSEVIAEQEAALMLGELAVELFKLNDVSYKRLITARDELVCPICMADEEAGVIGTTDQFPSGSVAPPIHIGCRCFIVPVESRPS